MFDPTFAESLLHAPHVVLGRRLRPFSFWHAFLLDAVGSPCAGHPRAFDLASLDTAVRICQLRFPNSDLGRSTLGVGRFPKIRACLLNYRYARFLAREKAAFLAYYHDFNSGPVYGIRASEDDGYVPGVPWYALCVEQLRRVDPALTIARAWDAPIGQSRWRIATHAIATGQRPLIETPEHRAAYAEAEAS